ncbi:uncharacterized protein RMCC_5451 [Mycolicibacterium canariasense]|uniref:Secreted protein n=1 Tax=Mycolicibacterium canariasense TaxID=228230 RepID=A0A100WHV3_MYCCR|nr:hypothetical protein [Mycolicibacterium canariasense]MCV7213549.1 hypothetical protein [Mycolicibacterium canariasense]ORV15262.1 hypothetical protein AWB94_04175 [Mycolicibacterium canariasense]GAS98486.1 uncharacterized protein RMCC_5451 [Mycolicibacterium canariasense]
MTESTATTESVVPTRTGRLAIPRSRGAASGLLVMILGAWGALAPFIGPYLHFAYTPDQAWTWTGARGWLEVLPGAVAVLGGLLLLMSGNRATAMLGGWLAVAAGAWFVIGRSFTATLALGDIGAPATGLDSQQVLLLELTFFTGLGTLIAVLGGMAVGRLSVRSVRDMSYARRPLTTSAQVSEPAEARETTPRRRAFWHRHTPVPH